MGEVQGIRRRTKVASVRVEQLSAEGSSALAAEQTDRGGEGRIRPWKKRILHCFALNTELKRLLNDEPTIAEKNEEELQRVAREEAKAVDDARFMTTFIPRQLGS